MMVAFVAGNALCPKLCSPFSHHALPSHFYSVWCCQFIVDACILFSRLSKFSLFTPPRNVYRKLCSHFDDVRNGKKNSFFFLPGNDNSRITISPRTRLLINSKSKYVRTYAVHSKTPLLQHRQNEQCDGKVSGHARRKHTDGIDTIITHYVLHAHAYHE